MARSSRRSSAPQFDPTYGDQDLATARRDLVVGRWQGPRDLLRDTGRDWDRRTHRMRLLADTAATTRTVESWQVAEPNNPDALVLRAETEVQRLFLAVAETSNQNGTPPPGEDALDRRELDRVARICLQAAERHPADPIPWVSLLTLARLYAGGHPHVWHWWRELQARDQFNREGHHQVLRHLSARWHGSYGEMYNFARDTAAFAPAGSPLCTLTQAARAEHYRHRLQSEGESAVGLTYHWTHEVAVQALHGTLRQWIAHRSTIEYAQDVADLNLLLHGLVFAGLLQEAKEISALLGDRPARIPWAYCGDPMALFQHWRAQLGG
ncbi:hypothetical protein [Streptacidiphilus jiangxiensis]|uniref:DUF4034 domain-containing protein n=1 Tax=Streptacidiphilus jiangxiensis TaxID=235985 RepID=A0A1H7GB44_STRJI|nr:hypothetical protein [Streptacidiphilus jiangxiensis]SEK35341.1 hypothetical protein SAMN05414137_101620 [Streptacidiphilus jiangxiensis]